MSVAPYNQILHYTIIPLTHRFLRACYYETFPSKFTPLVFLASFSTVNSSRRGTIYRHGLTTLLSCCRAHSRSPPALRHPRHLGNRGPANVVPSRTTRQHPVRLATRGRSPPRAGSSRPSRARPEMSGPRKRQRNGMTPLRWVYGILQRNGATPR